MVRVRVRVARDHEGEHVVDALQLAWLGVRVRGRVRVRVRVRV